jgi:hypothetical protein
MTDLTGERMTPQTPTDRFGTPIAVGCFIRYYAPAYDWAPVGLVTKAEQIHERDAATAGQVVKGWDLSVVFWTTDGRVEHGTNTWDENAAVTMIAARGSSEWSRLMAHGLSTKVNHMARRVAIAEANLEQARTERDAHLATRIS